MPPSSHPIPPARSASAKGRRTSESILATALKIMGEEGYANLTIGRIAAATGMRKGNLQYHFPSKPGLLRAVLRFQVDRQKEGWAAAYAVAPREPLDRLRYMIRYELSLNADEVVKARAKEKWAFAAHDDEGRRIAADWYSWVAERYAELIGAIDAAANSRTRRVRAATMYALLEGSAPYFGKTGRAAGAIPGLGQGLETAALAIARGLAR